MVSNGGAIGRQGVASLSELSGTIAAAHRVVLLLAAGDVTLLRVKVPPLSAARLKSALPGLVEERLIRDPVDSVIAAGSVKDGLRTVAVVQRDWLVLLANTLIVSGARRITAFPSQLCLPYQSEQPGRVTAAINEQRDGVDLILRLSEQEGIGLAIKPVPGQAGGPDPHGSAHEVIRTLCAVVPEAPIELYVPQSSVRAYQDAASRNQLNGRIGISADNWSRWVAGARSASLDLMAESGVGITGPALDWKAWRWPLALAAVILLINAAALNFDWWRMESEADALRATMIRTYKTAYPKESVIIDPVAQLRQKIAAARHDAGLAAPDDFTSVIAALGEAWTKVMPAAAGKTPSPAIAALEYRGHSLVVHLRPIGEAPTQQIKAALAERNLSLDLLPGQSAMAVWQIGSAK
jgi:general secretion pathway protein L